LQSALNRDYPAHAGRDAHTPLRLARPLGVGAINPVDGQPADDLLRSIKVVELSPGLLSTT